VPYSLSRMFDSALGKLSRRDLHVGPDIYQSIGVRPLINGRGTLSDPALAKELEEYIKKRQPPK